MGSAKASSQASVVLSMKRMIEVKIIQERLADKYAPQRQWGNKLLADKMMEDLL